MLKNLPEDGKQYLLDVFNKFWIESHVPPQWKDALIFPIPKPGRSHSSPLNYRPAIALTSCIGKTTERLINNRLTDYFEMQKILNNPQCGCRKQKYHRSYHPT
jgi:potassium voltage-gated channel Eag-related subfamily H protein 8